MHANPKFLHAARRSRARLLVLAAWLAVAATAPARTPSTNAVQRVIDELGDDRYVRREAAQSELLKLGNQHHEIVLGQCVRAYAATRDPEIKFRLHEVMDALVEQHVYRQARGYMGFRFQPVMLADANGQAAAAFLVSEVIADSPAQKAGLQSGDHLLKVGTLTASLEIGAEGLAHYIQSQKPGAKLPVTFRRGNAIRTIEVQLDRLPDTLREPDDAGRRARFFRDWLAGELAKLKAAPAGP